jgi:hypothetical protein
MESTLIIFRSWVLNFLIIELEVRATKLYGPVLERRSKADKIRVALSILEQWKFFFNLPSNLQEMIQNGRYDGAVRDYKKGKSMMLTSFGNDADDRKKGGKARQNDSADSSLPTNYKGVFEKVWKEVERIAAELREALFQQLASITNPVETQEKIIGYLIDLDAKRDPKCVYLEKQYYYLIQKLIELHNSHVNTINDLTDRIFSGKADSPGASSINNLNESTRMDRNEWFSLYPNLRPSEPYSLDLH